MQDGKKSLQQSLAGMKVHAVAELHSREVALQVLGRYTHFCAHVLRKMQTNPPNLWRIMFVSEEAQFVGISSCGGSAAVSARFVSAHARFSHQALCMGSSAGSCTRERQTMILAHLAACCATSNEETAASLSVSWQDQGSVSCVCALC